MMRRLLGYVVFAVLVSASCKPVYAETIAVDFGTVSSGVSILNPDVVTLNGATFTFFDQSFPTDPFLFAAADSIGIYGGPGIDGVLALDFAGEVQSMSFSYGNFGGDGTLIPIDDALQALFYDGGTYIDSVQVPGNLNQGAAFTYSASTFNHAYFYFSISADLFTADTFSYSPVSQTPEPSSLILLGTGLVGIVGAIRRKLMVR